MTAPVGRSFAAEPIVVAGQLRKPWPERLVSCVVDQNVGLPDTATLTYEDETRKVLAKTGIHIGTKLKVYAVTVKDRKRELLFDGEVTALEMDNDSTGSFILIRAQSLANRLFRGRKVVAYHNMIAADIVRKVAAGAGMTTGRIETASITYPRLSQANVSDWEFLQGIAAEHGVTLHVDQKTGRLEMVRPKPASGAPDSSTSAAGNPFVLQFGANVTALRAAVTTSDRVNTVEVRGWDVSTKTKIVSTESAITSKTVDPDKKVPSPGVNTRLIVADTPYGSSAEADAVAKSVAASVSAGQAEIEAVVWGDPRLRAGVPVALGSAGPEFSGKYTATAAHHVLDKSGYRTTVLVSTSPDRSLAGLVMGGNAPSRGPRMPGLAIGIVDEVGDPDGHQRGWVKLTFPWLSDTYKTDWVRTVQFGGTGGGGVFCPQVKDEVLVGFEQGSLDAPYVLGGLYNGSDRPSRHDVSLVDGTKGNVNRMSLVSRGGQRLELLDKNGGPAGVRLVTGDGNFEITLDQQSDQITISGPAGRSITLSKSGITVDAGQGDLTLNGRTVTVNGELEVSVQGKIVRIN
ncbi:VgrG-related protein [Actinocrispum wychmicini]|uniref:Uncharacterized protein involved in type VI secretion and phage assembly n=1 Tax=Actinocrispum wychmicini TaxID=1213861 RepID=A0A4R2J8Y4_9PSEU|nr:VgrG-related protein [Actinocrispum wychmicini]TCO55771.1 uncharacterized protein involved in type VI secretion and phage assembly [Actinocrispum wychmicini]